MQGDREDKRNSSPIEDTYNAAQACPSSAAQSVKLEFGNPSAAQNIIPYYWKKYVTSQLDLDVGFRRAFPVRMPKKKPHTPKRHGSP